MRSNVLKMICSLKESLLSPPKPCEMSSRFPVRSMLSCPSSQDNTMRTSYSWWHYFNTWVYRDQYLVFNTYIHPNRTPFCEEGPNKQAGVDLYSTIDINRISLHHHSLWSSQDLQCLQLACLKRGLSRQDLPASRHGSARSKKVVLHQLMFGATQVKQTSTTSEQLENNII